MRFGSLFSGIGGLDLGLERAGHECRWQVELDPYCVAVLRKHWPDVPKYGDIRELSGDDLEPVDLIAGGFPCQPVSLAGRRRGVADERWLWPEFARLIRVLRPRYALLENVPGLLAGGGMAEVLGDLAESGYDAEWDCIPAAAVGAPHLRYRVFIVAYAQLDAGQPRDAADAGSSELRLESRGGDGSCRPGPALIGVDGSERSVAHARQLATQVPAARIFSAKPLAERDGWWATEPDVGRVAHGVPSRVDRLRALGNAVVPQVAEVIGRALMEADR